MDNAKGKANQAQQKAKEVLGNTITMSGCPVGSLDQWRSDQWVISPILINVVYWGYNPLILTIDPNFQRDIQVNDSEKIHGEPTNASCKLGFSTDPNIQVQVFDVSGL